MAKIGYARVSSTDQDTEIQRNALEAAGCLLIREEQASGTSLGGRKELAAVLAILRPGDTLVVTRIDRLARSLKDFHNILSDLTERGIDFCCTEQPVQTGGPVGDLTMAILAAVAQFETQIRRERQMEGVARAKAKGVYKGRPPTIDPAKVWALEDEGHGPAEIARRLNIGRTSVYRALEARPAD